MLAVVRVIVPPGMSWECPLVSGYSCAGPAEFVLESVPLDFGGTRGVESVQAGEFIIGPSSQAMQLLPYLREEMTIVFPLLVGFLILLTFHWLGRRFLR